VTLAVVIPDSSEVTKAGRDEIDPRHRRQHPRLLNELSLLLHKVRFIKAAGSPFTFRKRFVVVGDESRGP